MGIKKLILIGGGGHALSVSEAIGSSIEIAGYVDNVESNKLILPYLGNDSFVLSHFSPEEYVVHHAVVYTSDVNLSLRCQIIQRYKEYESYTFIAHSALVTPSAKVAEGCALMEGAIVNGAILGQNSIINTKVVIEHGCILGHNVFVGPGAIICGDTCIGNNVLVGAGAVVRDGIEIADNVIIGMGSVVSRSILDPGLYFGNPCRKIKQ